MIAAVDLLVRLVAMGAVLLVGFAAPGWVLAAQLEPESTPERRWALAIVLGPFVVGVVTWTVGAASGVFLSPLMVGCCGLLTMLPFFRRLRDLREEARRLKAAFYGRAEASVDPSDGFPKLLGVAVVGYFLLKFDSMSFHTLGTNAGVMHAVGHALGVEDLVRNSSFAGAFPQPEGQLAPAAAFAGAFGYPGLRLWFAGTILGLAGVGFHLARRLGLGRRTSIAAATFVAFNPYTMSMNQVDGLENLLPALWLGVFALIAAGPRAGAVRPVALGLVAGALAATRHVFFLGLPVVALVLWLRGARPTRFVLATLPSLAWVLLQHHLGERPWALDEGLHPVVPGAGLGWWWTGPVSVPPLRAPYAAFPSWLLLPVAGVGALGTGVAVAAAFGGRRLLSASPTARLTGALVALPAAWVLMHGAVLQSRQLARPALLLVPIAVAGAVAATHGIKRLRASDRRAFATVVAGPLLLLFGVRALVFVRFAVDTRAYESFAHLQEEPAPWAAAERKRASGVGLLPAYTLEVLIAPLIVGHGMRWRDLAFELAHPDFEDRYVSLDEKLLTSQKGAQFTERWLPRHERRRPEAQPRGPGDPYREGRPMTVAVDLRGAMTGEKMGVDCRRSVGDDVVLDMAGMRGPVRLNVTWDDARPPTAVHVFKEYYGPREVELGLVAVPPEWTGGPDRGIDVRLDDGILRLLVPGAAFLSYAQILGERDDTMELLVGLEWHAELRCEEGPKVSGPFRL